MAINAKRIQAILDEHSHLPEPTRQVAIVIEIEFLLANPKAKVSPMRAATIATIDDMLRIHQPTLSAEERAEFMASHRQLRTGLGATTGAASLARTVARMKSKSPV